MSEIVTEMERGWNEKIVFSRSEFKGKSYADIRIYYEDDGGDWKPTKKGISIALDRFGEFKEHLAKLEDFLVAQGDLVAEP